MQQLKKLKQILKQSLPLLLICLLPLLFESCAHVQINDAEFCADIGPYGATCAHTFSTATRDIDKTTWDTINTGPDYRFGMVCTESKNFENWKAAIMKLCDDTKECTYGDKAAIEALGKHLDSLQIKIEQAKKNLQ